MATFKVTDPRTGKSLRLTSPDDTPPSEQELEEVFSGVKGTEISQAKDITTGELGIEEGRLTSAERLSGGFRGERSLEQRRAEQATALGLEEGTALEPVGFNVENLKDLPNDILDMIGPAFPAVGSFLGGLAATGATLPTGPGAIAGAAAGGAAGGAAGEALRQAIGENILGFDQGTVGERAGRIATEAAWGAAGELGAVGVAKAVNATKKGLLKSANRLLGEKGLDTFLSIFGKIAPNVDAEKTRFALNAIRGGDDRVLKAAFADEKFAERFANDLLFGDGDLVKHLHNLAKTTPQAADSVRNLGRMFLDIPDDVMETIITQGKSIDRMAGKNSIIKLARDITEASNTMIDDVGKELGAARKALADSAPNAPIDLTDINENLVKKLTDIDLLRPKTITINGEQVQGFTINKNFRFSSGTGGKQEEIFGKLVKRFFKRHKVKSANAFEAVSEAAEKGISGPELANILEGASAVKEKVTTVFTPRNTMKYSKFNKFLGNIDAQISGQEFKALGELSPDLTTYLQGIRSKVLNVADAVGNDDVIRLTQKFSEVAETLKPIRRATAQKDLAGVEQVLRQFSGKNALASLSQSAGEIDNLLKAKGVNVLDDLRAFNAREVVDVLDDAVVRASKQQKVMNLMDNSFKPRPNAQFLQAGELVDNGLPQKFRIVDNSNVHSVARALHKDATSLLRARFITNAVPVVGLGTLGFVQGGPQGAALGLAGGFALQNPALFRAMLAKAGAVKGVQAVAKPVFQQAPRRTFQAGLRGVQALLRQEEQLRGQRP
jgi:hypothetical protein